MFHNNRREERIFTLAEISKRENTPVSEILKIIREKKKKTWKGYKIKGQGSATVFIQTL